MKVSYRIYEQGEEVLFAACDDELLGKTLVEGDIHLDIKEKFYGGDTIRIDDKSDDELIHEKFERSTIANLVGEKIIEVATDLGFGDEDDVMWIQGVPHLQIVRL